MKLSLLTFVLATFLQFQASPVEPMQPVTVTAASAQNPPEAVYLQFESGFVPLTLFVDGESLIHYYDDVYNFYCCFFRDTFLFDDSDTTRQFQAFADELADSDFACYALPEMERRQNLSLQQIQAQLLLSPDENRSLPFSPFVGIATNYEMPGFLHDLSHIRYTVAEQKQVPAKYADYVHRKLNTEGLFNVPAIIRDVWRFDFDDDGKDEAFILATNLPTDELGDLKLTSDSPAAKDGLGYYTYVLFYSETFLPMDMVNYIDFGSIFSPNDDWCYAYWEPFSYQFDRQNNIKAFSMWRSSQCETRRRPAAVPIICDLDQDGREDFILISNYDGDTSICKVYLQKDDSQFRQLANFELF